MEIEEFKTWQWVLMGLMAGVLFSCVYAWNGPSFDTQPRDTMEQGEFENSTFIATQFAQQTPNIRRVFNSIGDDQPLLRDVTVHPAIANDPTRFWVTGQMRAIVAKPADPAKAGGPMKDWIEWKLFKFPAAVPYVPGYALREQKKLDKISNARRNAEVSAEKNAFGGQSSFPTVVEYLKTVSALPGNKSFSFKYAWWELPVPKWTLPPLAGLLIIGVAWPLTLSGMRNYGLAKPPPVKVKPTSPALKKMPVYPQMPAGVVLQTKAPVPPPSPSPSEQKKYGGEFYPVAKTGTKK